MQTMKMINGVEIPILGFGVFRMEDEGSCIQSIHDAVEAGFRQIDTAAVYRNEPAVGKAVKTCGVPREELFITTKLWVQDAGHEKSQKAIDASLERLQMDYVDLLLIHEPFGDIYGQWRAMEEAYKAGKVRAIGVSNMYANRLMDFILHMEIPPMIDQVRTNPIFQHIDTHEFMETHGIVHQAHSPFSQGNTDVLSSELLSGLADKYHKNVGQVILHWLVQRDIVTLCSTTKKERMKENLDIFDFMLTEEEMEAIKTLDRPDGNAFDNRDWRCVEALHQMKYEY